MYTMQYSYTITIREREMIALRDAIKVYKESTNGRESLPFFG